MSAYRCGARDAISLHLGCPMLSRRKEVTMKTLTCLVALMMLGTAGVADAWGDHNHHRGHGHFRVMVAPYWNPWFYPPRPYYAPVIVERAPPAVYIEQQAPPAEISAAPAPQGNYWYYCTASGAYYPKVKECPGGWQLVLPQSQGQP